MKTKIIIVFYLLMLSFIPATYAYYTSKDCALTIKNGDTFESLFKKDSHKIIKFNNMIRYDYLGRSCVVGLREGMILKVPGKTFITKSAIKRINDHFMLEDKNMHKILEQGSKALKKLFLYLIILIGCLINIALIIKTIKIRLQINSKKKWLAEHKIRLQNILNMNH